MKKFREPIAMNIFWAFCVFYGYTFAIGSESVGSDIIQYVSEIKELWGKPLDWKGIVNYYNSTGEIDFYRTAMAVFLSRFTENQRVVTLFYAIVYGFFYSRNVWFVIRKLKSKLNFTSIVLLTVLFLILPIWYINGVRMWTAMQIFLYGLLPFIWDGNRKKIVFLVSSVLVHFSFYPIVFLFFCLVLLGPRLHLFFLFFSFSLIISTINLEIINTVVETVTPEAFQDRTVGYRSEVAYEKKEAAVQSNALNWYVKGQQLALKWCLWISLIILYVKREAFFRTDKNLEKLMAYTLFFFAVANILSMLPSGGRFLKLPFFLGTALVLVIVNRFQYPNILSKINKLLVAGYILFIVVAVRYGIFSISIETIISNPIIMIFFTGETTSINDMIK